MRLLFIISSLLISVSTFSQEKTDKKLLIKVEGLLKGFNGDVGVFIKNLKNGKTAAINADSIFPTASIVKVPILVGIMDLLQKDSLKYHQQFTYADSLFYSDGDITGNLKNGAKIELSKLMMLMLTTSDNTASLWLQSMAGTGTRINQLMDSFGLKNTRVNSRTPGRKENQQLYGWGQTTPREMAALFEKIYDKELFSTEASEKMIRLLGRNYWDEQSISQIPPTVFVASKNGAVNASRSEVLLVMGPKSPYIFSIFTKSNKDQSWSSTNEAWTLARNLSNLLWEYFE